MSNMDLSQLTEELRGSAEELGRLDAKHGLLNRAHALFNIVQLREHYTRSYDRQKRMAPDPSLADLNKRVERLEELRERLLEVFGPEWEGAR